MLIKLLILLGGAYLLIVNGIFNVGYSWKAKRSKETIGETPTRIIHSIFGVLLIAYAIISYINPSWMINTTP